MLIRKIKAREILDSRGNPTVECDVLTDKGISTASVPSGASTGKHEALELRDKDKRYHGKGVLKAVGNVRKIANKLEKNKFSDQGEIDSALIGLDGTENKSKLGANAILSVSMACCKALAADSGEELFQYISRISGRKGNKMPLPMLNVINSGKHAGVENDIQEHFVIPKGKNFAESLRIGTEIYHNLKDILMKKYGAQATLLGDEGGFAPKTESVNERLELLEKAAEGYNADFALDCAASEFYHKGKYVLGKKKYDYPELIDFYKELIKDFRIFSIEDGFAEDDWESWKEFTKETKIQVVGDDLLVTNVKRMKKAIEMEACNSLLLKVNQIGTVSEAIGAANLAFKNKWTVVVSHRSAETEDDFIADLVVGLSSGQSKFGAPARSERNVKYNRLLKIEETK